MDKDSTVTLSGFCEHVISKTEFEIYRKIQDGKARRRERRAELRKNQKK